MIHGSVHSDVAAKAARTVKTMPTITLKNIPDALYLKLRMAAAARHRSLNSEVIACIERVLTPTHLDAVERLARARMVRGRIAHKTFKVADLGAATALVDRT